MNGVMCQPELAHTDGGLDGHNACGADSDLITDQMWASVSSQQIKLTAAFY